MLNSKEITLEEYLIKYYVNVFKYRQYGFAFTQVGFSLPEVAPKQVSRLLANFPYIDKIK